MNNSTIKQKTISGLFWRYAERCGAQGIQFVVSIVLARLLSPGDYGIIGLITVFISLANVFISCGFGQALVQKKDADDIDYSSVFYFNIAAAIVLYFVMFFCAPPIAQFYDNMLLVPVIRVLSVTLIIGGINGVQQAYVQKTMQFKRFFWATLGGTIVSAFVGIAFAYSGFGVWALVAQQLTNQVIDTIILWITVRWRPILRFSVNRMKRLFSYGWKLLTSNLLSTAYTNLHSFVIGKIYDASQLGYYSRGWQFPSFITTNINSSINSVILPVLVQKQNDKLQLKSVMRRAISTSALIMFPAMAGLAAIATPLVKLLLTDRWLPCVPVLMMGCFVYAFMPIHTSNLQAINAMGRSDIFLKLEITKKMVGLIVLLITATKGIYAIAFGGVINSVLSCFINAYPNKKLVDYGYFEQICDILPSIVSSIAVFFAVFFIGFINIPQLPLLIIQVLVGTIFYLVLMEIFKFEAYVYVKNTAFEIITGVFKK